MICPTFMSQALGVLASVSNRIEYQMVKEYKDSVCQVEKLLKGCDPGSEMGRRDYAILLL
jgi:hypothetical protein